MISHAFGRNVLECMWGCRGHLWEETDDFATTPVRHLGASVATTHRYRTTTTTPVPQPVNLFFFLLKIFSDMFLDGSVVNLAFQKIWWKNL